MTGEVKIGTSGWHYAHWRGRFYPRTLPSSDMLRYYARRLDTVEINNSFYRLPSESTIAAWRDATPSGFCFAAKASRYITHLKKLLDTRVAVDLLLSRLGVLGDRLGPILFQLPPRWRCDPGRLEAFLNLLPGGYCYAFEFRDRSWHVPEVYRILERHGAAFCIFDLQGFLTDMIVTAALVYVRLHGPTGPYAGCYDRRTLAWWARRIEAWCRAGHRVHVYFNNDQEGYAVRNAVTLRAMVNPSVARVKSESMRKGTSVG